MRKYRELVNSVPCDGVCKHCGCPIEIKHGHIEAGYIVNIAECVECKLKYSLILHAEPVNVENHAFIELSSEV